MVQSYLDLNHAEPVPASESTPQLHFYLPMHSVFKSSSSSTKLRAVFDGSTLTTTGTSLNQALRVGPTIQPTLSNLLLKFRSYPIALNADVSKMYREVKLSPPDKDLHRFIWRPAPNQPLQDFRMTRVTFGVSASPYLAVRTLQQTAEDHGGGEEYPNVTHHITNSFYVDDFLGGATTTQEAVDLFNNLREVLLRGGFNLCKWRSSSSDVLDSIPIHLQETNPIKDDTTLQQATQSKALGLEWDSGSDTMSPSICVSPSYRTTKRGLVSDVSKTYDTLGWISPAVLTMKLLFQQLWKTGHEWDQEVPDDLMLLHKTWRTELPLLAEKRIPRYYSLQNHTILQRELHGFSDASKKAFGAIVYVRTTYLDHPPQISLMTAKTKVAKLKPPTVPDLELCGAVLLTRLLVNAAAVLEIPLQHWHAWTDSAIVLNRLDGMPRHMTVFVKNRVSFILQATSPKTWKHVRSSDNPADCASRGLMPRELLSHTLWWEGPIWLSQEPIPQFKQPPRKSAPEEHSIQVLHQQSSVAIDIGSRSSNYHVTLSIAAWCLRFCNRIKNGRPTPDRRTRQLSGAEVTAAEHWLLRESQVLSYPKERTALMKKDKLPKSSRLKALAPLLDNEQLLRVGGQLANSSLSKSQQQPIIADAGHPLIVKLFHHMHVSLCHCGPSLLLCSTGSRLHVVGARRLSRAVCSKCVTCRRCSPKTQSQLMGDLPASRVVPTKAFTHTGMDFAGPFTIKLGHTRRPVKIEAHICVYICMTYKAVHLEVVSDQTTAAFQAALMRFISRRINPKHLYSDNGPNFTGAKNNLNKLYKLLKQQTNCEAIQHYLLTNHEITWHNSPPYSPHFGGLWESAVKSMKKHLKRVIGTTLLSFEELTTISCQVEACMNSRPLLPLTSHNQDGLMTLTASHFLFFQAPAAYPEDPRIPEKPHLLKQWNLCQALVQHFWTRWSKEYLNTLQARTKWQHVKPNLQTDDIVILRPEKHFSCHWPLAKIIETFPGEDGRVRVVKIKTATGIYKRAVTRHSLLFRPDEFQQPQEPPQEPLPSGVCSGRNPHLPAQPTEAETAQPFTLEPELINSD